MTRFQRPTGRQIRTGLDLLSAAVIVSVAFALAHLTWRLAGHADLGAIAVPTAGRADTASATDLTPAIALAPFGKPAIGDSAEPTTIDAELKGVVYAVPAAASRVFISAKNGEAQSYAVGDAVDGATIAAIRRDRVLLNHGGRIEYLAFPNPDASAPNNGSGGSASSGGLDFGSSPTRSIPAPTPAATPSTASVTGSVASHIDAQKTANGYRIGDNAPPGLRSGDVIQSVNGQSVTSGANPATLMAQAARNGSATIQILRDGKQMTLTVPTR